MTFSSFADFRDWLAMQRNDLQAPAEEICPEIGIVLDQLARAPIARMSGSGATCFGLFPDKGMASEIASEIAKDNDWWVAVAEVLSAPA